MSENLEKLIFEKGLQLFKQSQKRDSIFLEKNWWYKKMLSWTMKNKNLKTSLFRFIDVLPSLSNDEQFLSHFKEYFKDHELSFIGLGLGKALPSLMVKNIKKQISQVAKMFITGANVSSALAALSKNWKQGLAFSMDILGEATLSEQEAAFYSQAYLDMMNQLVSAQKAWPQKELLEKDCFGKIPAVNISIKASSLFSQIKVEAWEYSKKRLKNKLRPLFQKAAQDFIFINLDMEHYNCKNLFLEIFKELLMEEELKDYPHFGIVIQAYLRDSLEDLKQLDNFAKKRDQKLTVRLVKGAYWDSEVLLAKQKNWPIPVWTKKEETDANFEKCLAWLFKESQNIKIAVGSHNIRSTACALAYHQKYPNKSLEFQILYGMAEGLAHSLREQGYLVRLYCAVGDLIPGMSYLVRRLLENSANQSFILNSFLKKQSPEKLLTAPKSFKLESVQAIEKASFSNFPILDFSLKENREKFQKALQYWKSKFPLEVPLILKGKEEKSSILFKRENPSHPEQTLSQSFFSTRDQAEAAVAIASDFFEDWKQQPPEYRLSCLKKLAGLMEKKLFELSALQVFEVGKTWSEAVADVAEAVDFCNYYASSYERLIIPKLTDEVAGEESFLRYEAIGVTTVIAPWNFPLAILTGMTVAPLVCGNTVIIKPAEQSPLIAFELAKLLSDSGFPAESFAFLPGKGEEVGDYLVKHPKVSLISFTGSLEAGSQIIKNTSRISQGQENIKKCIVEMGGKNAIVIDSSADLDEAVSGVLHSAFGFQGQKCSACSRVIILEDIYEKFLERFLPAVESLVIADPEDPSASIGPLIDKDSFDRVQNFIKEETSLKLFFNDFKNFYFCPPVIYLSDRLDSKLMQEELFAPILACYKAKTLKSAIQAVNQTKFGLTAGLYSRHPEHIEKFKSLAETGNLYINRNCTGAMVKRHPFGGRKMSGLGSKTGGGEYLKQFLHTKIVTENNMRRGFSPELFH